MAAEVTPRRAYKFLASGATGPLSGFRWPEPQGASPGIWVEADGPLELCQRGVHVCRPPDLPYWLHDELWETEVQGDRLEGIDCLIVRRARLVRRIDGWHLGGAARFAEACVEHATQLIDAAPVGPGEAPRGYLEDAALSARGGYPAFAAFAAALAVARSSITRSSVARADDEATYRRERAWQAAWLTRALIAS
jgi:hypothetical protein